MFSRHPIFSAILLATLLLWGSAQAGPIRNTATGEINGVTLDPARANVTLDRVGGVVSWALAEISPNAVLANRPGESFAYDILPTIQAGDTGVQGVRIHGPPGYGNMAVTSVTVGGVPLVANCPIPGSGEFCATTTGGVIEVLLGDKVTTTLTPIHVEFTADTPTTSGPGDFTSEVVDGTASMGTFVGDADGDATDANSITVDVSLTQGLVLRIDKAANKAEARVGEVVTYNVEIRNTRDLEVVQVTLRDANPPNFKYLDGSTRLDGQPAPDPAGHRPLLFDVGTVPAWVDTDGNGAVDPGEPGYLLLSYQLVIGSGAVPGDYDNTAVARDFCRECIISNETRARVRVVPDMLFDMGTIIGKVFQDHDGDGLQDPGESGVPQAMVALDDGTYALTDPYGRYHFPAVIPGNRLVKLNLLSLAEGTEATAGNRRVVAITPGLMARANFGVKFHRRTETVGRPVEHGFELQPEGTQLPVEIRGSTEKMSLLVNGDLIPLDDRGVRVRLNAVDDLVRITGGRFEREPAFDVAANDGRAIASWNLRIFDRDELVVRTLAGRGPTPESVPWDGTLADGTRVRGGEIFQYQIEILYDDDVRLLSPRRLFGVNAKSFVSITLTGEAFETGEATLSRKAEAALTEASALLRKYPDEKIVIEGHTDSVGSEESNLDLSRRRAEAAKTYLTDRQGFREERFVVRAYGESKPVASNDFADGRTLNRRIEIKGQLADIDRADLADVYRTRPRVTINGEPIEVDAQGRFVTRRSDENLSSLDVELGDSRGRVLRVAVEIPTIRILRPEETFLLAYGSEQDGCKAAGTAGRSDPALTCVVEGRTEPGNTLEVDGVPVPVNSDGRFTFDASLQIGRNTLGLLARGNTGLRRIANLAITVHARHADGSLLIHTEPIPNLTVDLPPAGTTFPSRKVRIPGATDPGNRVRFNGNPVEVDPQGRFVAQAELPAGETLLVFEAEDAEGRIGRIERGATVAKHELFLMALADGKIGQFTASGYLEGSGVDDGELYTEGRLAFYMKGVISGKYLITAAMDTGLQELEPLFGDLDSEETRRLLTNLDPDRLYPVYGDSSTVVHDAETSGKFYLALDSETIHAVVGNYPIALTDNEVATYQRTLHGARFMYRSASRSATGAPDTQVIVFGADVEQLHVRDELRATGGSLYYLSHGEVIEGSEQVTLLVRDKHTGLVLTRQVQRRNADYTIKYPEGRVMFHRPVSSVTLDTGLVDQATLSGHPNFILVDYETRAAGFEETAGGVRIRQQIGDRVAVGGTYVSDTTQGGPYDMGGVDVELRAGGNSRFTVEYAQSTGTDGQTFVSDDGGLTYTEGSVTGASEGSAWKVAAELDVGEWFGKPNRFRMNLFAKEIEPGFFSGGNLQEQGTRRTGASGRFEVTGRDTMLFRFDREERLGTLPPGGAAESSLGSVRWERRHERWGVGVELFMNRTEDAAGSSLQRSGLGAAKYWHKIGEKLTASLEHQQTFDGPSNDQTTAGVTYQPRSDVALDLRLIESNRGSSAQAGVLFKVGESDVYLTERITQGPAGEETSTVLGAKSALGKSSSIFTEFQLEDTPRGERAISLIGVQQQWDPAPGLRVLFGGETGRTESATDATRRSALSTGLSYKDEDRLTALTRSEWRVESGSRRRTQIMLFNKLDLKLSPDLTLLAKYRYSKSEDHDLDRTDARIEERSLGVAFRPVTHDRFNALARYTRLTDRRPDGAISTTGFDRTMNVIAVETAYQLAPHVEWVAKAAARSQEERFVDRPPVDTETYLGIQRFNLNLWKSMDLGLEYRMLGQRQAEDRRQGWLSELFWGIHDNFGFGVGYNFTDFSDNEFSQNDYSVHGWFVRVRGSY